MLYYCFRMAGGEFAAADSARIQQGVSGMLESPSTLMFWTFVVICLAFGICSIGLQKGVEKIMKVTMLCLLGIMVVLAVRSVTLSGSSEGIRFYLIPDFKRMAENGIGNVVFGAMSQAFFTLSIGMGGMAIFGSYLDKNVLSPGRDSAWCYWTPFGPDGRTDCHSGLLCLSGGARCRTGAGVSDFAQHLQPHGWGRVWGSLFFLFLFFAALSTIVGVFENIVSFGMDMFGWSRKKTVCVNIAAIAVLSIPCILGFNVISGVQPLGTGTNIMDLEDFLVSNNILPLGSVVYLLFCTHRNGWGWQNFMQEANTGHGISFPQKVRFLYDLYSALDCGGDLPERVL